MAISERRRPQVAAGAGAGALTMVALCFSNGLGSGAGQTFAQATEALKHTYHVNDAALGVIPFGVYVASNFGGVPVAALCSRFKRTSILAVMFALWGVVLAAAALVPAFGVLGVASAGFVVFAVVRIAGASLEATDPAALPLIADWWRVEDRAKKVSVFNGLSAVGAFVGLVGAGILVDDVGWRWAFLAWLPIALVGAALMRTRSEPPRGAQDAAYSRHLEEEAEGADRDLVLELVEHDAPNVSAKVTHELEAGTWEVVKGIAATRTWRLVAVGVSVAGLMQVGIMNWGIAYFKRTFGLSGAQTGALAPVLGIGAFAGIVGGGFLADRLLERGMLRARLYVTAFGCLGAGVTYLVAFSMTSLWAAAPLLGLASCFATIPVGPQYALLMDVTPSPLRSQASAAFNVLQATGALGPLVIGILSTLMGENLRLALLCVSPFYLVGGVVILSAHRSYVEDVATAVADATARRRSGEQD